MKKIIIISGLVTITAVAYFLSAPLFISVEVQDELPVFTQTSSMGDTEEPVVNAGVFPIIDTPSHPASGNIRVVSSGTQSIIRYEDYKGTNGPDLVVYLTKDLDAEEFVSLGRARGNEGNINYEVPADIDISDHNYVMTWCRAFGVLFDYAEIR